MTLLIQKEGVNQLKVLSAFVTLEKEGKSLRQKNVVEITALTKGSVSNNCKKLVDEGLLEKEDNAYSLDKERLLELYRTHFEDYLRRRDLPPEFQHYNGIRTATKQRLNEMIGGEIGDLLRKLLIEVISSANEENQINTLRDAFHVVDGHVENIAEDAYRKGEDIPLREDLMMMSVVMDRSPELQSLLEDYSLDLTDTLSFEMSEDLKEVIDNA